MTLHELMATARELPPGWEAQHKVGREIGGNRYEVIDVRDGGRLRAWIQPDCVWEGKKLRSLKEVADEREK